MNVLFVSSGNKSRNPSKPGTVVYNQGESLNKAGINVDYFLIQGKGLWGYFKNIKKLAIFAKKNRYILIHAHYSLSAFTATFAMLFTRSIPLVVSLMGSDIQLKGLNRLMASFFSRFFWAKTIVKSKSLLENEWLQKSIIISNGIDISKIEAIEKRLKCTKISAEKQNTKQILFAADFRRESKNYKLAENAMDLINYSANLKVLYNTSHEQILEEIFKSDVLLLTSLWEGSPNIIKEAMACNCPVVATDVGDIKWLFGDEPGHFITSFEPKDVAKKIEQALDFVKKYGRTNGKKRIIELELNAEKVAEKIIGVYKDVLH